MRATGESLLNAQISRLLTSPRQIHFEILTNIFDNLDKYILKSGQIHLIIWTNRFDNMDKQEWTGESLLNAANATPADIVGCSFIQYTVHCSLKFCHKSEARAGGNVQLAAGGSAVQA